ncbi:MAG: hypothetical protein ACM37W_21575 [Actinomycetota bacterium]
MPKLRLPRRSWKWAFERSPRCLGGSSESNILKLPLSTAEVQQKLTNQPVPMLMNSKALLASPSIVGAASVAL